MDELKIKAINTEDYFESTLLKSCNDLLESQRLSLIVKTNRAGDVSKDDYHRFLTACEKVTKSHIYKGFISCYEMNMIPLDTKRNMYVNRDGSKAIFKEADKYDTSIAELNDIEYRTMLVFNFKSKINGEELKKKFGNIFESK